MTLLSSSPLQRVELYTQKKNSHVQRNPDDDSESSSEEGGFDEHKELLADALKDSDIVTVRTYD